MQNLHHEMETKLLGLLTPMSITDNPGTISIKGENTTNVDVLERLEPWQAERMLGLRLPMTGEMKDELQYRKKQMEKLGH